METLYVDFATVIIGKLLPEDFSSYSRDGNIPDTADASDWVLNVKVPFFVPVYLINFHTALDAANVGQNFPRYSSI